ncbi:hypothetical protein K461DRAFT_49055 [Myriangium duriaei CBS 260.36]|uniref:Uncharacterized protein n=1 Tax=Myriangium duriaei CBS 260.36 TaxID=1168546 RepID=A0A9P4MD75_9PEZI|nr:hypothetical protein K461DRAFT_49055 [Myriangium duriaei CBS 260.36]
MMSTSMPPRDRLGWTTEDYRGAILPITHYTFTQTSKTTHLLLHPWCGLHIRILKEHARRRPRSGSKIPCLACVLELALVAATRRDDDQRLKGHGFRDHGTGETRSSIHGWQRPFRSVTIGIGYENATILEIIHRVSRVIVVQGGNCARKASGRLDVWRGTDGSLMTGDRAAWMWIFPVPQHLG